MEKLTFTMENYLEAVYELSQEGQGARVSDIAERMGVTKASTSSAMSTLAEKGLIVNERYREIFLTPLGREVAELTATKHHILRRFFTEILHIPEGIADEDACAIEHVISCVSVRAMQAFMHVSGVDQTAGADQITCGDDE